jgi:type IV pilus assembly protein PilM
MALSKAKTRSVVGLDVESGFIAAAELGSGGAPVLHRAATTPLMPGVFHEGEVTDVDALADQLKLFFAEHKLAKRVRLGLASQRVALRVLDLPAIQDDVELEAAVRFQAQEELPMPLEQAVLDHRVLERYDDGETARMRVLVVGARRDSVEHLLAATRKAGLTPELVDLSAFAMVRALFIAPSLHNGADPNGANQTSDGEGSVHGAEQLGEQGEQEAAAQQNTAVLYCYVGGGTNLAIAVGTNCIFNRVLPNGAESMAATLAERGGLTVDHSRQWLRHVGLERDLDLIEGEPEIIAEARTVLERGAARIADDVRLSLEYYAAALSDARRVERVVMAGPGIALEGLPAALESQLGLPVVPRSLGSITVDPGALDGVDASELTVAAGLALDEVPR